MLKFIDKIFSRKKQDGKPSFQEKFLHFQALLAANDEAHKAMSELIELIANGKPFSKGGANTLFKELLDRSDEMVRHLLNMTDGRHQMLLFKIQDIGDKCFQILSEKISCPEGWDCPSYECHTCTKVKKVSDNAPYSYNLSDINDEFSLEVGSKMSRLGEISGKLDIPVPRGFCLTARLFEDIMSEGNLRNQIDDILNNLDYDDLALIQKASREIQDLIISFNIPASFRQTILDAYDTTFPGSPAPRLSVRSSALGEDSEKYSFAGLHHSELNVNRDNLVDACWEVLASKYSPQSLVYRFISGLRDEDMPMSVGCMEMINSQCSGILFTKDPNGQGDNIIIQAVRGLGTMAVEGRVTPQEYIVSHSPEGKIFGFRPGNQKFKDVLNIDQGVKKEAIMPEYWYMPCLTQDQVSLLAGYACRIEEHFAVPQDIEWAVDNNGCLHILQSRPLNIKPAKGTAPENMLNRGTPRPDINELDSKYEVLIKAGDCASTGVATGSVFKVQNVRDIKNFPNGSIIVAKKNLPEFASLIHKVAAVVTELGSTTGHLSIIARELNVPILTNIGNAASRLENGMEITLFADEKRIYKGRVDEIINYYKSDDTLPTQANDPFRNSPLYRIWHSIAKLIFKLNLTETNSPRFSPEHCETIHDIIRFAHETAMKNMFSLYESERLDSGQAFYLKFDVPLEIYIIDLGNGLKYKPDRDWVYPDEVASPLFQAFVKGMTTPGIRWSGHLNMDTKGYASIIFGNIVDVNRADSSLGATSYLLLSEKYMNFFSRLGYHFSRLDAFASDEINKNYVNFNLRGGAADPVRRARRARVIARILELLNFSVVRNDDNVTGTIRKIPEERVYFLLGEMGRLMGAVRNTDVTMVSEEYMEEFIKAFMEGDPAPAIKLASMWR